MQKINRCKWAKKNSSLLKYHDKEWGTPVFNDQKIFEALSLEIFQAGLSWEIILNKRNEFRHAFDNFNYNLVSKYDESKLISLYNNKKIIRNKLKIRSIRNNAISFIEIRKEFKSFNKYIWSFTENQVIVNNYKNYKEIPVTSNLAIKISYDLKKRGFKFIGNIIVYSFIQAIGIINDHTTDCFRYKDLS
ncbi:MAG: DNA-3-methyladenine glycosylase I [Flavobacteriales bacterium]|nr:DNA-3-methyladenine glycosylase I [Flavobacteriales bacterium]